MHVDARATSSLGSPLRGKRAHADFLWPLLACQGGDGTHKGATTIYEEASAIPGGKHKPCSWGIPVTLTQCVDPQFSICCTSK